MPDLDVQIALPIRLTNNGQIATLKTGNAAEILQRAAVLCATRPGTIDNQPTFGVPDQTGRAAGPDLDLVDRKLVTWIPDITALSDLDRAGLDHALAHVGVRLVGSAS